MNGAVPGTVAGTIVLPDGDGTFAATSITVTSAPAALGYTTPFNVFSNFTNGVANSFVVASGQIVLANSSFAAQNSTATAGFSLNLLPGTIGSVFSPNGDSNFFLGVNDRNNTTLTYTATAVPWETDSLPVIGSTVLLGLGLWGKRKLAQKQINQ